MSNQYIKKPVIIDAVKYSMFKPDEAISFADGKASMDDEGLVIHTLEGSMRAKDGDYIIEGIKGEYYPCDSDIFHSSYSLHKGHDPYYTDGFQDGSA